jgi:hypothetical protein
VQGTCTKVTWERIALEGGGAGTELYDVARNSPDPASRSSDKSRPRGMGLGNFWDLVEEFPWEVAALNWALFKFSSANAARKNSAARTGNFCTYLIMPDSLSGAGFSLLGYGFVAPARLRCYTGFAAGAPTNQNRAKVFRRADLWPSSALPRISG